MVHVNKGNLTAMANTIMQYQQVVLIGLLPIMADPLAQIQQEKFRAWGSIKPGLTDWSCNHR